MKASRATVTDLTVEDLPDGRRKLVVDVVTADGRDLRMQVHGDVYVPIVGDPGEAPSLILEFVPRAAAIAHLAERPARPEVAA